MSDTNVAALGSVLLAVICVCSLPAGAVTAADVNVGPGPDAVAQSSVDEVIVEPQPASLQTANNTTVQHRNPDETSEDGDLNRVEGWLGGRMTEVLIDCTEGASAQQVGACDLNGSYPDYLERYVDVNREQDRSGNNRENASDTFQKTRDEQEEFNDRREEFRETREEYEEARENGNNRRARELARRLLRLQEAIARLNGLLQQDYRLIQEETGANTTEARANLNETTAETAAFAQTLRTDIFVQTNLTVEADGRQVSFVDPLAIQGQISLQNGTALANRTIRLDVGGTRVRTETDEEGRFNLTYRPIRLPLDASAIFVQYRPSNTSIFFGASSELPVEPVQTRPNVTVESRPANLSFGQMFRINGSVSAAGLGVGGVPIVLMSDGQQLATTRTSATGNYTTTVSLPATVRPGERNLTARIRFSNRVIAGTTGSTPVRIGVTETNLSLRTAVDIKDGTVVGDAVRVDGVLQTADGRRLSNQVVRIEVGDSTSTTVSTGSQGQYASMVPLPEDAAGNLTVRAEYTGRRTNLNSSAAAAILVLPAAVEESPTVREQSEDTENQGWIQALLGNPLLLGGGILLILVLLALGYRWISSRPGAADGTDSADEAAGTSLVDPGADEQGMSGGDTESLLGIARSRLERGDTDGAVTATYAAIRRSIEDSLEVDGRPTHWEFLTACRGSVDGASLTAIERATEAYEQAVFAPEGVSGDSARAVFQLVSETFEDTPTSVSDD